MAEFALGEVEPETDDSQWSSAIDAATAFREAAQWALCFDPGRARALLDRSGTLFHTLGHPFGDYLKVMSGSWFHDPPYEQFAGQLQALAELTRPSETEAEEHIPAPLLHPQQQAYLMLAAAASPPIAAEFGSLLRNITNESPHRFGVVPVGALGIPIRWFWRVTDVFLKPSRAPGPQIAADLAALGERYAEAIELARTNEYCWRNAAAPVDVGDLDITGVAVIASRRFGVEEVSAALAERLALSPYPARALLEIAMEYARAEP
jgi:hypothetical protein